MGKGGQLEAAEKDFYKERIQGTRDAMKPTTPHARVRASGQAAWGDS
jgi:hypothetical protein